MQRNIIQEYVGFTVGISLLGNFKLLGEFVSISDEAVKFKSSQETSWIEFTRIEMIVVKCFLDEYNQFRGIYIERDTENKKLLSFIEFLPKEIKKIIYSVEVDEKTNTFLVNLRPGKRAIYLTYYKVKDVITTEGLGNKPDRYKFELVK